MANLNFKALQRQKSFMFLNKLDSFGKYMEMLSKYSPREREREGKNPDIFAVNFDLQCVCSVQEMPENLHVPIAY